MEVRMEPGKEMALHWKLEEYGKNMKCVFYIRK